MKNFSMIAAVSLNGVIGDSETNTMPWHIPEDLKHFKAITSWKSIVMGSRTFESIGRALPDRRSVVITRNADYANELVTTRGVVQCYTNFNEVYNYEPPGFIVIGGGHIYRDALRLVPKKLFITIIHDEFEGDVRFPIMGYRFMHHKIEVPNVGTYYRTSTSGMKDDGHTLFEFVEFELQGA